MFDTIPASSAGDFYAPSDTPQVVRHRPQFTGRAGEYFGIWFVNLLLSIVTLGIYSAWAKVRTERYFYGNTSLAGANFEYLASPIADPERPFDGVRGRDRVRCQCQILDPACTWFWRWALACCCRL